MNQYQHSLEKGSKKHLCPKCGKKTFVRYIDNDTGEYIADHVGRCDREINCDESYTPKQYFADNKISNDKPQTNSKPKYIKPMQKQTSFISTENFKGSLKNYEANNFVKFLNNRFGVEVAKQVMEKYFIGTSKYQFKNNEFPNYLSEAGASVFWQMDSCGKVRTGKIMLYSPDTGKRIKEPFTHINWIHTVLKLPEFELKQCLFGEHLLKDKTKQVAIVESEKTAIIASVYFPQFIWLAFGGLSNFNAEKCSILKGRTIILFPDLKGFEKWSKTAKELSNLTRFIISDLLESKATETENEQGLDLADFLIRFNFRDFE